MQPQIRKINDTYSICDHKLLGKGSTGNVYLGFIGNDSNRKVAIKSIDLSTINNEVTRYLLSCEIASLSNLGKIEHSGHENIVKLIQVVIEKNNLYMVMELLEGGTLAQYIKKNPNGLPQDQAMHIFRQIIEGYQHVKGKKIVHRDLKPDNILFRRNPNQSKQIAIIDFGYCEMEEVPNKPQVFYNVGSPKYMSPEAYKDNHYSEKSDIWAIGVMLYEMLMGSTCDKGMTMEVYLQMLERRGIPMPQKLRMFQQHLIANMLEYNHKKRFGCDHVLKELQLNMSSMEKQKSVMELRNTVNHDQAQFGRPKQVLFHSVILPQQKMPIPQRNSIIERGMKSQSKIRQPNENAAIDSPLKEASRSNGFSFHLQQNKAPGNSQILGRVQNVELPSAKQIVHRRQPALDGPPEGFHPNQHFQLQNSQLQVPQSQITHHSQVQPPQNSLQNQHPQQMQQLMVPKQSTIINIPSSPATQTVVQRNSPQFFTSQRQGTPVGAQNFEFPSQNGPRPANAINHPPHQHHGSQQIHHFYNQTIPSTGRVVPAQVRMMEPASNKIQPQPMDQVIEGHKKQMERAPMAEQEKRLVQNRHSMKDLSPERMIRIPVNSPPLVENMRPLEQPSRPQERIMSSPFKNAPRQPEEIPKRVLNQQFNQPFEPPPQLIKLQSQDNNQHIVRLVPQAMRQIEGRNVAPQFHRPLVQHSVK